MPPEARVIDGEELVQVETLAAFLTSGQIADYLGIGRTTFYEIMERQPEVAERYKSGRAKSITDVAQSLIRKAKDGDVGAQAFYLKTQAGWREKQQIEHSGRVESVTISADMSQEQASELYTKLINQGADD